MPLSSFWFTLDIEPPKDRSFLAYHPFFSGMVGAVRWSPKREVYLTPNGMPLVPMRWMRLPEDPVNNDVGLKVEVEAFRRENT